MQPVAAALIFVREALDYPNNVCLRMFSVKDCCVLFCIITATFNLYNMRTKPSFVTLIAKYVGIFFLYENVFVMDKAKLSYNIKLVDEPHSKLSQKMFINRSY